MDAATPRASAPLESVLLVLIGALTLATVAVIVSPAIAPALVNARLDVVIGTLATLTALGVALLAWARFREGGELGGLFRASAFLMLAMLNAVIVLVSILGIDDAFGMALDDPGSLPLLANALSRGASAVLLIVGGMAVVRHGRAARLRTLLILLGPALLLLAVLVIGAAVESSLPTIIGPAEAERLRERPMEPLLGGTGLIVLAIIQVIIGIGFAAAAGLSYLAFRREQHIQEAYLSVGLVVAAFSQLHAAIHPGVYASLVTTGDLLRVAFYVVLLAGVVAERRADLRALRRARSS
jgi:hypothetical protein